MSKTIITLTGSGTRSGISFTSGVRYKVTSDMLTKLTVQDLVAMSASVFYQDGSTESISNLSAKNNWKLMQHGASATKSLMDVTAQWQTVAGGTNDNVDTGDFNNLLKTGFYRGSSMANAPVSNSGWWYITVQAHHDGNWVHQTAYLYGPSFASGVSSYDMFVRTMDAGSWGPWRRIWNETNFDPSSKSAVTHAHSAVDLDGNMAIDYSNSDLNSLSGNASYRGTNMSSAPDSGWWWIDSRRHTNQDWMNQLAFPFGTGAGNSSDQNIYWRKKSAGGWQDWQRLVTSGNLTTFGNIFKYPGWTTSPGYNANSQGTDLAVNFTYANNAPWVGPLWYIGAGNYGTQFNARYTSNNLSFRNRNGDSGQWSNWCEIWHSGNFDSRLINHYGAVSGGSYSTGSSISTPSNRSFYAPSSTNAFASVYHNGYPAPFGNTWQSNQNSFGTELFIEACAGQSSGSTPYLGNMWFRNLADWGTNWSDWSRVITDKNISGLSHVMQKSSGVTMTGTYLSNTQGVFTNENTIRSTDYPSVGNGLLITQSVGYGSAHTFQTHMWYSGPIYYRRIVNGNSVEQWVQYLDSENGIRTKPNTSISPTSNGEMVFELTSNTQLKIKVKGSDGVVRTASLTLS